MNYLFLFLLNFQLFTATDVLEKVRYNFPSVNTHQQVKLNLSSLEYDNSAEGKAYYAAMLFMKSKYVLLPTTKFKYFKKGKKQLNHIIEIHNKNIEIRYIRFVLQSEIPTFLGYNNFLEEDYSFIVANLEKSIISKKMKFKILNTMLLVSDLDLDKKNELIKIKDQII